MAISSSWGTHTRSKIVTFSHKPQINVSLVCGFPAKPCFGRGDDKLCCKLYISNTVQLFNYSLSDSNEVRTHNHLAGK